jgi:hypothetical protein
LQEHIDGIKVYAHISKKHFDLLLQKAKQRQLPVTGHLGTISTRYAIEQGIHGLEHGPLSIRDFGSNPNNYQNHLCHRCKKTRKRIVIRNQHPALA